VEEVGNEVENFRTGDRITASHHVPCNTCFYCYTGHQTACETLRTTNFYPGGFSEYIRVPSINVDRGVFKIPKELSYEEATFHEPLGCVIRAQRTARLSPGQTVLVLGSGIAGILNVHLADVSGADHVVAVDLVPYRMEMAKKYGANEVLKPDEDIEGCLRALNNGRLADVVFVCTGAKEAQIQALKNVERGGTVLFFAPTDQGVKIPVSINDLFFRNDITLTTSYGATPYDSWLALELIRNKKIDVENMITHRFPLSETASGFQKVAEAQESMKVMIEPQR
jgi:L-iditol 2-dehydrogenase